MDAKGGEISRYRANNFSCVIPGALPQAGTFRALGAPEIHFSLFTFHCS